MTVKYPEGPTSSLMAEEGRIPPGAGINNPIPDADEYFDFTTPVGKCSGVFFGIVFQLPKWGFERYKIEEAIEVSPVFQQYYQLTIRQKQEMEAIIKSSLASIATALSDLEMLKHDLRKYSEFMDYFRKIDFGKERKNESLRMEGEQSLKAVFIDQVDVHTDLPNTPIALRSIVARWPTIISDFMKLKDEDKDPAKIAAMYHVSEAEAVVLSTKNKLYVEWRDQLFRRAVEQRFDSLLGMVVARTKSFEEYKNMLKPTLARYRQINEAITGKGFEFLKRAAFWRPDAQAMSIDFAHIWAWRPFAPSEKYKATRQAAFDEIPAARAGFTTEEISEIRKEDPGWKGMVKALPAEPSMDDVIRDIKKKIEIEYGVKLTASDVLQARENLVRRFEASVGGRTEYEAWIFSPYFMFYDIPIYRNVIHLPDGSEIENMMVSRMSAFMVTQNIIIARQLELIAKDKELDNYIMQMLGEVGKTSAGEVVKVEELKKEYLIKLGEEKKEEKKPAMLGGISKNIDKVGKTIGDFFGKFGIKVSFFRAKGPYEFAFYERLSKYYFAETGTTFGMIREWFKSAFGVP